MKKVGAATGLIVTGFNHVVHKTKAPEVETSSEGDSGCDGTKPGCRDVEKATQKLNEYDMNNTKIYANTIVSELLLETTEPGEILSKARNEIIETYGSPKVKEANEVYDSVKDILSDIKSEYGKIPDAIIYDIVLNLSADSIRLTAINTYLEFRIKYLCERLYMDRITHEQYGGSWGGGGASNNPIGPW